MFGLVADQVNGPLPIPGRGFVVAGGVGGEGFKLVAGAVDVLARFFVFLVFLTLAPFRQSGIHDRFAAGHVAHVGHAHATQQATHAVFGVALNELRTHGLHFLVQTGDQVGHDDFVVDPLFEVRARHLHTHFFQDIHAPLELTTGQIGFAQVDQRMVEIRLHGDRGAEFGFGLFVASHDHVDFAQRIVGVGQVRSQEGVFLHVVDRLVVVAAVQFHVPEHIVTVGVVGIALQDVQPSLFVGLFVFAHAGLGGQRDQHVNIVRIAFFQFDQDGIPHGVKTAFAKGAQAQLGHHAAVFIGQDQDQAVGPGQLHFLVFAFTEAGKSHGPGDGGFGQGGIQFEALAQFIHGGAQAEGVQVAGALFAETDGLRAVGMGVRIATLCQAKPKSNKE